MNRFPRNLVIIQAHPDDAEAWSAGTLALLAERGWNITIAPMTAGGLGGIGMTESETIKARRVEAEKAAGVIGASYHCFDRRDGYLFDDEAVRIETVALIRRAEAGVVITHAPFDYHQDHRSTCTIVDAAVMVATLPNVPCDEPPLKITPLFYHGMPMRLSDRLGGTVPEPHFFVDITGRPMETKMKMLEHHKSQRELMKVMHKMDNFFNAMQRFNAEVGSLVGVEYAECYWQHLGGGFQNDPFIQEEIADFIRHKKPAGGSAGPALNRGNF